MPKNPGAPAPAVDDPLIPDPDAKRRCGHISDRTWWNWQRRYADFPSVYRIGSRNYRKLSELDAWIAQRRQPPNRKAAETRTTADAGA